MIDLRRLDDRWLPPAAAAVRALEAWWRRVLAPARGARAAARTVVVGRGARGGRPRPRSVSVLGTAVGAVLVVDLLVAATYSPAPRPSAARSCGQPAGSTPGFAVVGPGVGQRVMGYLSLAACRLNLLVDTAPAAVPYAIVDLDGFRSAADVGRLLGPTTVVKAFFHLPGTSVAYHEATLTGRLPGSLVPAYRAVSSQDRVESGLFRAFVAKLGGSAAVRRYLKAYLRLAADYATEATALRNAGCGCVFAVVVQAGAEQLHRIARLSGVRAVDPAPPGTPLQSILFTPLLPGASGTVRSPYQQVVP